MEPGSPSPRPLYSRRWPLLLALTAVAVAVALAVPVVLAPPGPRQVHLIVSNQSLDHPLANITVTLDGEVVVDQSFFVANAHNWTQFDVVGTKGVLSFEEHDTGAAGQVTLASSGARWVTLQFWASERDAPQFTVSDSSVPPAFA